jgi:hypothetical protein
MRAWKAMKTLVALPLQAMHLPWRSLMPMMVLQCECMSGCYHNKERNAQTVAGVPCARAGTIGAGTRSAVSTVRCRVCNEATRSDAWPAALQRLGERTGLSAE